MRIHINEHPQGDIIMSVNPTASSDAAAPEPGLTGADFVRRAIELRPLLVAEQADTERRTRYSPETFATIREQGFFRMLQPRARGGYEIDLPSYVETAIELARGCPSTGWCTILAAGHASVLASYYSEQAQDEFWGPDNDFIAPLAGGSTDVTTERVEGGWIISGKWLFCSGVPYATHHQGLLTMPANAVRPDADENDETPTFAIATFREGWEMLEDWGDLLGLRGSGSNSVQVTNAFVPDEHIAIYEVFPDVTLGSPGYELYGNPLYAAPFTTLGSIEPAALAVGMAHAMLDEFLDIVGTRKMPFNPAQHWYDDPYFQQDVGKAFGKVDSARAVILNEAQAIEEKTRAAVYDGVPFTGEDMVRLYVQGLSAAELAWEAGELIFKNASSSAARDGQRLQRLWRDLSTWRNSPHSGLDHDACSLAQLHYGLPLSFLGSDHEPEAD
jgi:3-hydroxy-9,10-secoandrosta-1,3,5(10)-triene-9,17-dione monooxygenase